MANKYIIQHAPFEPLRCELESVVHYDLPLRTKRYAIFGSAVMYLHGLREEIGDIDIFVDRYIYDQLKQKGWVEQRPRAEDPPLLEAWLPGGQLPVHAFYDWKKRGMQIDVQELLNNPEYIQGWPVQRLEQLRDWKASIAHHDTRPNDYADIAKIDAYLEEIGQQS